MDHTIQVHILRTKAHHYLNCGHHFQTQDTINRGTVADTVAAL